MVNAPLNLSINETVSENKFNNILSDITNSFVSGQFLSIVISEDYSKGWFWGDFLKKDLFEKWSILITNLNEKVPGITAELPDVYVILFSNYQNVIKISNTLRKASKSWNPGAKFLLMTNIHPKTTMDGFVIDILNSLWSRNAVRVSLVVFNESAKTAFLFSSSPYSKLYNTCKKIVNFSQLQEINLVNDEMPFKKIAGYQFEPLNSFLGCPLLGHTFPFPPYSIARPSSSSGCRVYNYGIEVQLVKLMGHLYNFSLEILTTPSYGFGKEWFYMYPNGSRRGMLEDIFQNKIDLAFAGVIPPSVFYFQLGLTNSYMSGSLSWYVPAAEIIPVWKLVLNTFSGVTWLFMLSVGFLFTVLHYLINIGFERNEDDEPMGLTMVALALGFSTQWTRRPPLRIILLAWSLFCFHVALMFNTRLFSVLTEPPFDSQIDTIQQLHDSRLQTCTFSSYKLFYTNQTYGIMRCLVASAQNCDSLDDSVKVLLEYKNLSILAKDDLMEFKIDMKKENIHRLKHNTFINYPVVMPVAKGSVFLGVLNRLVYNITESGLVLKWMSDVRRQFRNKRFSRQEHNKKNENSLMTKEDFVWLYFVFLGGQAIAFIVFLMEMYIRSNR